MGLTPKQLVIVFSVLIFAKACENDGPLVAGDLRPSSYAPTVHEMPKIDFWDQIDKVQKVAEETLSVGLQRIEELKEERRNTPK